MAVKRGRKPEKKILREIIIKREGTLWDVNADGPIPCTMEPYDDCFGRCEFLSINVDGIAKCHDMVLGKIKQDESKDKKQKRQKKLRHQEDQAE